MAGLFLPHKPQVHSFTCSNLQSTLCRYVNNVESEVARSSLIGKVVSFQTALEAIKWRVLSDRKW